MIDNYVCVDNKYYDPYFILNVDSDDDLEYIIKSYKYKAKKYHPDKALNEKERIKNEKKFKILTKCIEFIKERRENSFIDTNKRKKESDLKIKENKNFSNQKKLNEFNDLFEEKSKRKLTNKNSNSYKKEIKQEVDEKKIINQFKSTKFSNEKFNLIFDYNLLKNNKQLENNKQIIHYTTDGFYGYNTSDLDNYAIVRSFNGLLISDDLIDSTEINYGNNYSDYNDIYKNQVKNPNKLIKLNKDEIQKVEKELKKRNLKSKKSSKYVYESDEDTYENQENESGFQKEQNKLYKKNLTFLIKQQEKDKKTILKSGIYDKDLIKDAEDGVLDMSPSLLRALDEHYKYKRLN
jgi:hypothetical protein